ncbi:hypothetical protein A5731_28120 [Mycolicibacterium conceptionense]|uniref:DUF6398 domain-containing protein n=2 Tax=Mycobacteriaceae TaxID=1762 RepID=A0A1A2VGM4_9MYCO|nr:hypothetical protein A5718_24470 [Mycolicibacterium conceptionense]OBE93826.1 hypothetical protein A5731_28120 [Mycolicibacterium conceptionense]OBF15152.1 hypothetical protein A5726_00955 [Mycolicibacterium conceptionense]OBF34616.1 hypothetical protein A5720_23535 [Mycolicibacterium conceptionense]OBH99747.1 hypothetical protein A5716_09925 [Mycolicibacterium conceptionense]
MSKSNRQRRAAKHRQARRNVRSMSHEPVEPDLFTQINTALSDPDPLHLLSFVSSLLTVVDPRGRNPFARADETPDGPSREELTAMFIDVPTPETTALLSVVAELANDDDLLHARIRRELATRPAAGPQWLTRLAETSPYRAVRMAHVLGDGDNIMIGVHLAGDHEITLVVYVDHNLGQLVKDAFVVPEPIADIVAQYQLIADEPDVVWEDLSLADARVWVEEAIAVGAITFPPIETESWPACRPLIEWIARALPAGGAGYQPPQWDSNKLSRLTDRFFASQWGRPLDDADHRDLLESLLWYGTDYGPGDPLRWSGVQVEILFMDWLPRKIVAPAEYLAEAPELLGAFVRFAHKESGVRADLTDQTLAAIDYYAPEYQKVIRSPRPQGPAALLDALGAGGGFDEPYWYQEMELESLARQVGGEEQLDQLNAVPLADEPFDWSGIPDDVAPRVAEVLELVDRCCDTLLDVEYRTVARRVLARIASAGPAVFRRKSRTDTAAAAVVWIAGKANGQCELAAGPLRLRSADITRYFDVKSSPSQRAEVMLRAGGFPGQPYDVELGSPDYLTAERREQIIRRRDDLREEMAPNL